MYNYNKGENCLSNTTTTPNNNKFPLSRGNIAADGLV